MKLTKPPISIGLVREDILSLGERLEEVEAVGIVGSLAWDNFDEKRSDIDLFVVLPDGLEDYEAVEKRWWKLLHGLLAPKYQRDVDILFYTLKTVRQVPRWESLSMASDGVLIFDKGKVGKLFKRIVQEAEKQGLERIQFHNRPLWQIKPPVKIGTVVRVEIPEDEEI
ncbi:MAG TPA: nucleotidyltransferase domain-containing protein [Armatimonadetes bacterium]|nr:nucleotidyltransferase domain-containing protein [Armatimonadota bacterium]